jgi:hypothetical protein
MIEKQTPSGFRARFTGFYVFLTALLVAGAAGVVVMALQPGKAKPPPWSSWRPAKGSAQTEAAEIAAHVGKGYLLGKAGSQLVGIITSPPELTQYTSVAPLSTICTLPNFDSGNCTRVASTSGDVQALFCGLGQECAIENGDATAARERLLRREALELALYTFKYVPSVNALIAYMPPPAGSAPSTIIWLERANLSKQLSMPITKTLPLTTPPLPSQSDPKEQGVIDKLTLPVEYSFRWTPVNGSRWLLLVPAS